MRCTTQRSVTKRSLPSELPDLLPSRPIFSSFPDGQHAIALQRFQHPRGRIEVPGLRYHFVVVHLTGPVLIEDEYQGGGRDRRWLLAFECVSASIATTAKVIFLKQALRNLSHGFLDARTSRGVG